MNRKVPLLLPSQPLIRWSTRSWGPFGDQNEMQSVQPTSQDSDITIPMKVLRASGAAAYLPNCAHTVLQFAPSPPSLVFPLSFFFLNGCLHCSLSFLLYLHLTAFLMWQADGGVWQTFPVPDSLLWSGAPAMPTAISASGLC